VIGDHDIRFVLSFIFIIIIERKDLGGVMSKDYKDTYLQTLETVTKREMLPLLVAGFL